MPSVPSVLMQALLSPNNAGMFRGRPVGRQGHDTGHRQVLSELSSNSTTDEESDAGKGDSGGGAAGKGVTKTKQQREAEKKAAKGGKVSPFAPKRRMTFGGIRSDKRGEVYSAQRRPSFLQGVKRQAVGVAEAAAKATRRLSFQGNSELVAIGVRLSFGLGEMLILLAVADVLCLFFCSFDCCASAVVALVSRTELLIFATKVLRKCCWFFTNSFSVFVVVISRLEHIHAACIFVGSSVAETRYAAFFSYQRRR